MYKNTEFSFLENIKIYGILIFLWILSSAQQCSRTDSCGTYSYDVGIVKASLVLNGTVPSNVYKPITQIIENQPNSINIQGSLWYEETTNFGIQVESYDKCNGIPRFKSNCCITKNNNSCVTTNDEAINQVTISYQTAFKCKVTIRAICYYNGSGLARLGYFYDLYEGVFDIDPTSAIPPTNTICNLIYKRRYDYGTNPTKTIQQICLFEQ